MVHNPMTTISTSVSEILADLIHRVCKMEDRNISYYVRRLIIEDMKKRELIGEESSARKRNSDVFYKYNEKEVSDKEKVKTKRTIKVSKGVSIPSMYGIVRNI